MPCIGKETSGIGEHAYEAGKVAQIGQRCQLVGHSLFVVVEPPCASLLYLGNCRGILETAQDGADGGIVIRV